MRLDPSIDRAANAATGRSGSTSNWQGPAAKVVLLFGAGASAFSGPTLYRGKVAMAPPLGRGPNGLFARMQAEGGVAMQIPAELHATLTDHFESGMKLLERLSLSFHCAFQRQIALHLASYRIRRNNLYLNLLAPPHMRSRELQYSTINYDMLLDQAFARFGLHIEGSPKDSPSRQFVTLLKLHGASNFLVKIKNRIHNNEVSGAPYAVPAFGGNIGQLYLARSFNEIRNWCSAYENEQFSPVLAQYVGQKPFLTHAIAFEDLQAFWAQKIAAANTVILIGVRHEPADEHIWRPLLESNAELLVVDPDFSAIESWGVTRMRKPQHIAKYFSEIPVIQEAVRSGLCA